jgi:nitrogen fixation NifU-like protein
MLNLTDLYQEIILDHGKAPRNKRTMETATHSAEGYNPLCGDQIKVYLHVDGETVKDVSFSGNGCAISQASASMMTEALVGKTIDEANATFQSFHAMLVPSDKPDQAKLEGYDELQALEGVKNYPNRIKCATLAWHAFKSALEGK